MPMDFTEDDWRRNLMREFCFKQLMEEEEIILRGYNEHGGEKHYVLGDIPAGWRHLLRKPIGLKHFNGELYTPYERTKRRVRDALPVWGTDLVIPVLKAEGYDERLVAMVLS